MDHTLPDQPFAPFHEPFPVAETPRWTVVAKPAGMHCAGLGGEPGGTLVEWVFERYPECAAVAGRGRGEGGLMHRLDRDTSGLVLFARDGSAWEALTASAAAGLFSKRYWALGLPGDGGLAGSRPPLREPPGADPTAWRAALRRGETETLAAVLSGRMLASRFRPYGPGAARVACASPEDPVALRGAQGSGKAWSADTYRSEFLAAEARDGGVLAEVGLTRGFRHQVRAHLSWLGLALAGDALYGEREDGPDGAPPAGACLSLRACSLSFPDPDGGGTVSVSFPASLANTAD